MATDALIERRMGSTLSAIRRLAVRISGRRRRRNARTDFLTDHLRRDIGLLDGRSTTRSAELAAERRI